MLDKIKEFKIRLKCCWQLLTRKHFFLSAYDDVDLQDHFTGIYCNAKYPENVHGWCFLTATADYAKQLSDELNINESKQKSICKSN